MNGREGVSWQWWGGGHKGGPVASSCTHTYHAQGHYTRTHTRGERVSEKNTELRIEPCGTPGPLGTAAAFNLFVSWMGDWFDSDNEANYVKSSVCSQNGCSECDCLCMFVWQKVSRWGRKLWREKAFKLTRGRKAKGKDRKGEEKAREGLYCSATALTKWRHLFKGLRLWGGVLLLGSEDNDTKTGCQSGWT